MDGVLCDFYKAAQKELLENPSQPYSQSKWGFFIKLEPIEDAIWAFKELSKHFDVWILTRPSTKNIGCYTEKAQWVLDHLGEEALERLILSCDKTLLKGDYLIDDNYWNFDGEHIFFGKDFKDWKSVVNYLLTK